MAKGTHLRGNTQQLSSNSLACGPCHLTNAPRHDKFMLCALHRKQAAVVKPERAASS